MRIGKADNAFEKKVTQWNNYANMLDEVMKANPDMEPEDKMVMTNFRDDILKGVKIRRACIAVEDISVKLMQASWIGGLAGALIAPGNTVALAAGGAFIAGAGLFIGSRIFESKHPDQFVSGLPDRVTLDTLGKYVLPYMESKKEKITSEV